MCHLFELSDFFRYFSWKLLTKFLNYNKIMFSSKISAPVAQLDKATDYGSVDWGFESLRACQFSFWPHLAIIKKGERKENKSFRPESKGF